MPHNRTLLMILLSALASLAITGCAAPLPAPEVVIAPQPRMDNGGEYMSPFTQDGTVALWVDKGVDAKTGKLIGGTAGAIIGQQVFGRVPFVGGIVGNMVGNEIGRQAAIDSFGGMEYITSTSDMSFDTAEDMAVYLYATYGKHHESFEPAVQAAQSIYPRLGKVWYSAIQHAPRRELEEEEAS